MPTCKKCASVFPNVISIGGRQRNLQNRKFCLECSPFGKHNTSDLSHALVRATDTQIREAVSNNITMAGVLRELGYSHQSSAYRMVKRAIDYLGLTTTHWVGQAHGSGKPHPAKLPLSAILVENRPYLSSGLKYRLISEGVFKDECARCGITDWMGEPLSLQVDHINGSRSDNRVENLRILCPNCHTQTDTWGSKKRGRSGGI